MKESDQKLTLPVDEAGVLLGLSRGLMYEGIRRAEIPSIKVGRRILVPRHALLKMLEEPPSWGTSQ